MTDRPLGPSLARPNHVDVVEWDRERTVAAMAAAIRAYDENPDDLGTAEGTARAIFDALDPEGQLSIEGAA